MLRLERRADAECYGCENPLPIRESIASHDIHRDRSLCLKCLDQDARYRGKFSDMWRAAYMVVAMQMLHERHTRDDPRQLTLPGI